MRLASEVHRHLESLGVGLDVVDGRLVTDAPPGAISHRLAEDIKAHYGDLVSLVLAARFPRCAICTGLIHHHAGGHIYRPEVE